MSVLINEHWKQSLAVGRLLLIFHDFGVMCTTGRGIGKEEMRDPPWHVSVRDGSLYQGLLPEPSYSRPDRLSAPACTSSVAAVPHERGEMMRHVPRRHPLDSVYVMSKAASSPASKLCNARSRQCCYAATMRV